MIRLFLNLCKCFQMAKNNNDYQIYLTYTANANPKAVPCPFTSCGAKGNYYSCGSYTRSLICYTDGHVERYEVIIDRIECISCEHSHAILPSIIIPYSPFSFHFVISLLYAFITHKYNSVKELCLEYDISISTLYRIYYRFIEDRKLMLGMMKAATAQAKKLLDVLANSNFSLTVDCLLHDFYRSNLVSFLQARCRIRLIRHIQHDTRTSSP